MKILMVVNTDGALYIFRKPIVQRLISLGHDVESITDESDYFERLGELGVKTHKLVFLRHSVSLFSNIWLLKNLLKLISEISPDVIHSFTHKPAIFGTIAAKICKVEKIFVTITGLGTLYIREDFRSRVLRKILEIQYRVALSFVNKVFFQNKDDMRYFLEKHILDSRKAVLTNGSGIDFDDIPKDWSESGRYKLALGREIGQELQGKKLVLFPARGIKEKGFSEFYLAAKIVKERKIGDFIFVHVGLVDSTLSSGFTGDVIIQHAKDHGVYYLGFKSNIFDYLIASDIVCLPSYREGVPRSLIEALSVGKVIVTTDTPGCRETVEDGWNGYKCAPRSSEALVDALLSVSDEMLVAAKERSRAFCENKFDVAELIETTLAFYFDESVDSK